MTRHTVACVASLALFACQQGADPNKVPPVPLADVPGHESITQDTSHKESPRLLPAEVYLRSYLLLFGGQSALQVQQQLAGSPLFDNWNAYLSALGLPNYALDLPRKDETNALMMATFERLGLALCNKAVEKDLKATPPVPIERRTVFRFDTTADPADGRVSDQVFATRFGALHRRFLGYPSRLAPPARTARFRALYLDTVARHDAKTSRFTPAEAGWAAMCQGLIRHPEFHLY